MGSVFLKCPNYEKLRQQRTRVFEDLSSLVFDANLRASNAFKVSTLLHVSNNTLQFEATAKEQQLN